MNRAVRTAAASVAIATLVLALKLGAWWLTDSVALLADALESVVNVAAAGAALAALWWAARPADANHPYGHAKAEYLSAVLEGVLIVGAAVVILQEVWSSWATPRDPALPPIGLALNAAATVLNALWAAVLFRRGRAARSPALLADARHLLADVITSVAVLAGLGLAAATGLPWIDPLLALLAALHILFSGWALLRQSVGGLMDEAVGEPLLGRIRAAVAQHAEGAIEAHDLRSRQAGRLTFIEFHLVVPGEMRVLDAHEICDRVEAALRAEIDDAVITIHVEPEGKAKHRGVLVL